MPREDRPPVWALLGAHRGDNHQVLALAEALGLPFEVKRLSYNRLRRLPVRLLGATLASLKPESRAQVEGPPPDLLIAVGHRSVPVVRAIRARSGGTTRAVHLGNPRISPNHFSLVITTPQYGVKDGPNVVRIPVALGRPLDPVALAEASSAFLAHLPSPRRLLLLGGPTRYWQLDADAILAAVDTLLKDAETDGGSLILLGSPRTPTAAIHAAETAIQGSRVPALLAPLEGPPSYAELLANADAIFVTADSVSMASEALKTGKPLGLVPIRRTLLGTLLMGAMDRLRPSRPVHPRDLRYFWAELERRGLAGTVERPAASNMPDVLATAVEMVRPLLGPRPPQATAVPGSAPPAQANRA